MGDIYTNPPQSRNEAILRATIDGTEYTDPPQSRIEDLLLELKEAIEQGGGSVESYEQLTNKPQINGTTLSGDKSTEDLIPIDKGLEFDSDGKLAVSLGGGLAFNSDGEIDNLTEANPSDSATGELSKLKVGSDIYSVVTKAVNDLTNYYTKSEVYTKAEVNNIAQARFAVVAQLPTQDIQTNVIYLVPKSTAQTNNDYDEYIYALKSTNPDTYGWEKIGDTEIDLSDYVTTQALNTALANYTTTTDLTTLLAGKQNTLTFDSTPTAQSTNPVTSGGIKTYVDGQGAKTASGNPITLTDAEAMNADHVVATITPTQTGSGTPSPSNVRPFIGVSFLDLNVCKKNQFDNRLHFELGAYGTSGNKVSVADRVRTDAYVIVAPNTQYTLSVISQSQQTLVRMCYYDANFSFIGNEYGLTFTTPNNCHYLSITLNGEDTTVKCQVEIGDQGTNYEDYDGKVYTVQLGDTYYGATLDVTSGKLTCEWIKHSLTSNDVDLMLLQTASGYRALDCSLNDLGLPPVEQSTSTQHSEFDCFENVDSGAGQLFGTASIYWNGMVYFWDNGSTYANKSAFQQGLKDIISNTGISFIYKLATPIEIQLTPQQIALLENNNTITTNVSSLDITYQTNTAIGDTASALDKRVTRLESKVPQPPTTDGTYKLTVTVASGEPTYSWESAT